MKIRSNCAKFTLILTYYLFNSIVCQNAAEKEKSQSNEYLILNSDNGTKAVYLFYDADDLEESIKENIANLVFKELEANKIPKGNSDEDTSVIVNIKNPMKTNNNEIKVEVFERPKEPVIRFYNKNSSKDLVNFDINEYVPEKGEDGTSVGCEAWRSVALEKQQLKPSVFIPKCNPDGSYVPEQCDDVAGFCWCVNHKGEEIGGTIVKFERPKCNKKSKRKGIMISASGQNLIDIGSSEEGIEGFKCDKERRSIQKLRTLFNEATQRIRVPVCENDDYASVQCTTNKKHCWCATKNGEEIVKTGKIGIKPRNCSVHRTTEVESVEVYYDWNRLWKVISEWQSAVRLMSYDERDDNPNYVYKPRGVLVKLPQSSGFKKSIIFLPQESPDNDTEIPYDAWVNVMKNENPNFDAISYEIDNNEMSKYQSIEVPDGNGNYYLITIVDFLKIFPTFEDLWKKVNRNASEFETRLKKKQEIDWKKLSEQPKSETSDPMGILAAGTFEMRSEQKICFCYNKRYWEKLQRFINSNQTSSASHESKVHGRSMSKVTSVGRSSGGCRTICGGDRTSAIDENMALMEGLTMRDVINSESSPEAKAKVDNILRDKIAQINPMRNLLRMNVEHFEQLSGIEFNNIRVPARYFSPQFWDLFSQYTKQPLPVIEQKLEFNMNAVLEQSMMTTSKPQAINLGKMIRLMSESNLNTKQVLELAGYSTRTILDDFENTLFHAVRASFRAISVPYKLITGYFSQAKPETKITSTPVNSDPVGIPGTISFRTGICNFGFSVANVVRSLPDYLKDMQIYFGDSHKCDGNCTTFNKDVTYFTKYMATWSYTTKLAMQINIGARIYRQVPFYMRLYTRKFLRQSGFSFVLGSEAHFEVLFQTVAMLVVGTAKPIVKIPYIILFGDGSIVERTLGTFPAIIEFTGDFIKPLMVITEPLLRGVEFLRTGDFQRAMKAGRTQSESFDKHAFTGFNGRPTALENYMPYAVRRGQTMGPDGIPRDIGLPKDDESFDYLPEQGPLQGPLETSIPGSEEAVRQPVIDPTVEMQPVETNVDTEQLETGFLDRYQGMAPESGYGIDFKQFPAIKDEPHVSSSVIRRFIQLPFFLLVAGGPIYGPANNLVAPIINISSLFLYTNLNLYEKVRQFPSILERSSSLYKPITMIMNGFLPITDLLYDFWTGQATAIQTTTRAPMAFMSLATSPIKFLITAPTAMVKEVAGFFRGSNGLVSMFSLQFSDKYVGNQRGYVFKRVHEGFSKAQVYASQNPQQNNLVFVTTYTTVYYMKPQVDIVTSVFNGGVGNIINADKAYQYNFFNWNCDPYNSMVRLSQNQAAMYEVAADQNMYLQALIGGEDPDELKMIGIDAERLVRANIDPAMVLLGGQQMLPTVQHRSVSKHKPNETELFNIGIKEEDLKRIGLSYEKLMSEGLWNVKPDLLMEYGIDPLLLVNRVMRNSIVDKKAFLSCGISIKKMMLAGIKPDYFLAAGVSSVGMDIWKKLQINPSHTNDAFAFFKIGIQFDKLLSLNVNPVTLVEKGIVGFSDSVVRTALGIDKQKLVSSVYSGFNHDSLVKMGIEAKKLFRAGYSPVDLVTGSPTLSKMSDVDLLKVGVDVKKMRSADLKPRMMLENGIMANDMYKFNRLGVNADEMLSQLYSKSGVGMLADNEYSQGDNVYWMSTGLANMAKRNGVPDNSELYGYLTNEKKSVFVTAKENAFAYFNYQGGGFLSWLIWNVKNLIVTMLIWFFFHLPFQVFSFFGIISSIFSAAASTLGQAIG